MNTAYVLKALKSAIKARGLTYREIGNRISLSEAGMKRLMNAKDISLGRMMELCRVIDVPVSDILEMSQTIDTETQHFSEEHASLFLKSPLLLKIYYKARVEQLTTQEIQKALRLSKRKLEQSLLVLENADLLKLKNGFEIVPFEKPGVWWRDLGQAFVSFRKDFTEDMARQLSDSKPQTGYYPIYHLFLTDDSRKEMARDLDDLIEKYLTKTRRDGFAGKIKHMKPHNICFMIGQMRSFE